MRTSVKRPWQRILAMVLCMAMVLCYVPATAQAVEDSVFTILAASDFQERGDTNAQANANGAANVTAIVDQVTASHDVDAFFFCGDYSLTAEDQNATQEAYNVLSNTLNDCGLNNADKVFIQGNHEPGGMGFLAATGGYVKDEYAYYVLNEDDWSFGGGSESAVRTLASNLDAWLSGLTVGEKPVFVLSHVPLHYSMRTHNASDALYAEYLVDVLNKAGQRGLNIIFLFGHNHSGGYDAYIGGSTSFIGKGDTLWIADPASSLAAPQAETINFTYMNAGYVGYYEGTAGTDAERTMSVFEISGDDVTIRRYDADGEHGVKPCAGNWGADSREPNCGHELNARVFSAAADAEGNDFAVTIPAAVSTDGLREGFSASVSVAAKSGCTYTWSSDNTGVATVEGGSNGSATIRAVAPGTVKITVTESGATAAAAGDYELLAETQAGESGSAIFYLTVAENTVEVQDGVYYRLVTQLTEGKSYLLVNAKSEGAAYALRAPDSGTVMTAPTTVEVHVSDYNSQVPYVQLPASTSKSHIRWQYIEVDYSRGYGVLKDADRTSRLAIGDIGANDRTALQLQPYGTAGMSFGWAYSYDEGLYSEATVGSQKIYATRFYDARNANAVVDEWGAVRNGRYDANFYSKLYAYEETPLTYTLSLSDMRGEVKLNDTDTGTRIVKTWATGKVEYIPLTTGHLSVGSGTAGTYTNVTVTYDGVQICGDYTLVVGSPTTITVPEGYYYRLTDTFASNETYLFLNSNAKGDAKMMGSTGDCAQVEAVDVPVSLDADGVPSVLSKYVTETGDQNNGTKIQEWKYRDGVNMYQPQAWTTLNSNYLLAANYDSNVVITGNRSGTLPNGAAPIPLTEFTYLSADTADLLGYRTVAFKTNQSGKDKVQMYLTYHDGNFYATRDYDRRFGDETYAYQMVKYTTAEVSALGIIGGVNSGSAASAKTGTYVQITYPDGTVENIPVTAQMLGLTAADIADKSASYDLTGLTLKYQGVTLTTNYTLKVRDADTDPVHPEPGSVELDKQKDTTEYVYDETGVARVDLSVSGVPMDKPVDVLLIVDTSASVEMYRMENGQTRIQAMRDAVEGLIDELAHPNTDGSLPDISLAISEFNNYTYFGAGNTFYGKDDTGKEYEPFGYTDWNANGLVHDYTSVFEMQNFNPAVLTPKSGTNYDVAFQKAYEIVSARKAAHPDREQIVIFMTDGICYQYNYMSYRTDTPSSSLWARWLLGELTEEDLGTNPEWIPDIGRVHFYNPDGNKQWMAEALKGSPDKTYKVIWNENTTVYDNYFYSDENNLKHVPGLGATVYSIGFGIYVDGEEAVRISDHILGNMASDQYKFFKAQETEDLMAAFADIGHGVRKAATNAEFYDQLGEEFDLQMKAVTNSKGETIAKRPTIQVKSYDVYKYGEIGMVINGITVTEDMVGERKSNVPVILETVTFNDAGTEAYSDKKSGNILENGIINAYYFLYNTTEYDPDEFYFGTPGPETFLWNIGDITERELVLSYYVYLEDSMGENGGHTAGVYDTNQYADLHYLNYNGEPRTQETVSPELDWETARVNYGFYLVDENGNIIRQDGSATSFANKVQVGSLSADQVINLNTNNTVTPQSITLGNGTVIDATMTMPAGYELYVGNPSATIHTNSGSSTGGSWAVDNSGTTYLDNGSAAVNSGGSTKTGEYDDTTVWFAVVYTGMGTPVTNKTVEATDDPNEFVLTLEAYSAGKVGQLQFTKPADIVLVLDHSGSMRTPTGAPEVLESGTLYTGGGAIDRSKISTDMGAHTGYYVCQSTSSKTWFVMRFDKAENKWYGYSVPTTESIVDIQYKDAADAKAKGGYTEHTQTQSWVAGTVPEQLVFYKSQYAVLYDALLDFVAELRASGTEHNVSIIGFAGSEGQGTRLYVGGSGSDGAVKAYKSALYNTNTTQARREALYRLSMKNVQNDTEYAELLANIDLIETNHSYTCPTGGLQLANEVFAANAVDLAERDRIVVLFTDGIPNRKFGEDTISEEEAKREGRQAEIYDEIVKKAWETKHTHGAQVYSICTTTLAAGEHGENRTFLDYASSNYPNATAYSAPGTKAFDRYFHPVGSFDALSGVFSTITQSTVQTNVTLNESAVLKEVLTDYFELNPDDEVDVEVYTAAYNGDGTYAALERKTLAANKGEGYYVEYLSSDGVRNDIIEVSGFDYAEEYVSSVPRTVNGKNYYGSKLIVKVRIRTRDGFWGGNNVPTNETITGIYDKNRVYVEDFPEPQVNVPIKVTVTAKDKTIYYDGEIDAPEAVDPDGFEGDELLQEITAGGKPVEVETVTNTDGSTTTTFVPQESWMDDFAEMSWGDQSTTIESDLSSTEPKDYTYTVVVKPTGDGKENTGDDPGTTDNIAGAPQSTGGKSAEDKGHIYILVPELTFRDSVTEFGTDVGGYDFKGKDFVDETIVWVDMELGKKPGDGIPALDQNAKEPTLELEYTPEGDVTQFVGDTKVDVTVSINDKDITDLVKFKWESCTHTEHGSCGTINTHEGEDAVHEFWVHTTIAILPDTVVIDYGLSVDIDPLTNDLTHVKNVTKTLKSISYAGTYGQAQVMDNEVRYTLNTSNGMQMNREETFKYQGSYAIGGKNMDAESTITVIPATIIYYEDSFLTYESFAYTGTPGELWQTVAGEDAVQNTDRPGTNQVGRDLNNIYGYDSNYTDEGGYSLKSYHKITVDGNTYGKATFTFTGTAFDVIALSSGTTGTITVAVHAGTGTPSRDNRICNYMVDTYYGYKYTMCKVMYVYKQTGGYGENDVPVYEWTRQVVEAVNSTQPVKPSLPANPVEGQKVEAVEMAWILTDPGEDYVLYQVPVMKVDMANHVASELVTTDNGYGTYTAVITVSYDDMFDHEQYGTNGGKYDFMLDAIRIYDQANDGKDNDVVENAYKADGEGWPTYTELRDLLISANDFDAVAEGQQTTGVIFIDNTLDSKYDISYSISDYANFGPNNELYLAPGQSVAFHLDAKNVQNVHLALKSVGGTAGVRVYGVNADGTKTYALGTETESREIATATDLYYDITGLKDKTVVIVSSGSAILSITNIKMTHSSKPTVPAGQTEQQVAQARFQVSRQTAELALTSLKPAPVNPFTDVHEGDYYYQGVLWAAGKGITSGTGENQFSPAAGCSRAQVVMFLWRAAGSPKPGISSHPFTDVQESDYYYEAMLWALEKGVTAGVDDTHFGPGIACSRAQIVTFLWRAADSPEPGATEHPFTDVQPGSFYEKAVLWAVENGITKGVAADSFAPNLTCTRGQVVTFLYCAYTK